MRKDLKMRRGKEIAQACHAIQYLCTDGSFEILQRTENGAIFENWENNEHPKIAVGIESEVALLLLSAKAEGKGILTATAIDAGKTEIPENTITCIAVGPATKAEADELGLSALPLR